MCDPAGQVVGIVSERDIVHGISMHGKRALEMRVRDLMTHDVITCERSYTVYQAYSVMVDHAFRHLPVVEDGNLKGLVSISDVVKLRLRDLERQIRESKLPAPEHL